MKRFASTFVVCVLVITLIPASSWGGLPGTPDRTWVKIAGDFIRVHHNTFFGSKVRAVVIRGVPREEARIDHNWFAHERADENLIGPWPLTPESRIFLENNAYGLRHPKVRDRRANATESVAIEMDIANGDIRE
jgi:hypothetical protein